ncbi:hypothetical protein U1Q18_022796, partial [Sarracenia purpurea var. burkii]
MEMETMYKPIAMSCLAILVVWAWKLYDWAWLGPKRLEKHLREQGFKGNPYRFLVGDLQENAQLLKEAHSKPIGIDDDIVPRVYPIIHKTIQKYGKDNFIWFGRIPRLTIMNPDHVKEVLTNYNTFQKHFAVQNPLSKLLLTGIGALEGDKYQKHRKIIYPAFHLEKLKGMVNAFDAVYSELFNKWEKMAEATGSVELDVFPLFDTSTSDVISRVAFGSSYGEGIKIFVLLKELMDLTTQLMLKPNIPGFSYLPTKMNLSIKKVNKVIDDELRGLINRRMKEMKAGEPTQSDFLGLLLESNLQAIQLGNKKAGMSMQDIINECKLFYYAGQETTGILQSWTMVMLSRHPEWQERARQEVFQVLGKKTPDYEGLSRLKIVTAIVHEVLRLFPPVPDLNKIIVEDTKLGNLTIPKGVSLILPTTVLGWDEDIYGPDAKKFNPERFFDGIVSATKGQ